MWLLDSLKFQRLCLRLHLPSNSDGTNSVGTNGINFNINLFGIGSVSINYDGINSINIPSVNNAKYVDNINHVSANSVL